MGTWMPPVSQTLLMQALAKNPQMANGAMPQGAAPPAVPPVAAQPQQAPQIPPLIARPPMSADESISELQNNATASRQTPKTPAPPAPSDDPAISPEMRKALEPVNTANAALDTEQKQYEGLAGKYNTLAPPNYQKDFQPHGVKKVLGNILSYIPTAPTIVAGQMLKNMPQYNRAKNEYVEQRAQLGQQLDAERGMIPIAEARARVAQTQFNNQLDLRKENREETTAQSNADYKNDIAAARQQTADVTQNWHESTAQNAIDRLSELSEKNKNDAARQNEITDLHRQLLDVAKQRADNAGGGAGGGMTSGQQREFNARTRTLQRQLDQVGKDRSKAHETMLQYEASGEDVGPALQKRMSDYDKQTSDLQAKIDAAHDDIMGKPTNNGGAQSAAPGNASTKASPAAANGALPKAILDRLPAAVRPGQAAHDANKYYAYSADGKTWGPVPDWLAVKKPGKK